MSTMVAGVMSSVPVTFLVRMKVLTCGAAPQLRVHCLHGGCVAAKLVDCVLQTRSQRFEALLNTSNAAVRVFSPISSLLNYKLELL